MILSYTTNPKNQRVATTTLKFGLVKCSVTILYVSSHPFGPVHLALAQDRATESENQQLRYVTHIWDQVSEHNSISYRDKATVRSPRLPARPQHVTTEYSADSRNRTPRTRVSLHIQKPKPQASIENKIEKIHKLFGVYNNTQKMMGVGKLRWQCYRHHQQNPALTVWF